VNTLLTQFDYHQWKAVVQAITTSKADAVSFQEPNVAWNKINKCCFQQILKQPMGNALIATTISTEIQTLSHQRGGMLQTLLGDWVSCRVNIGQDTTGLGQLSFIKLQGKMTNSISCCQAIASVKINVMTLAPTILSTSNTNY